MESKLNVIDMMKFETKEECVEWIETMHLQNTNGRETGEEMFRLGVEASIEELTEFKLFSIPVVVQQSELLTAFVDWYNKERRQYETPEYEDVKEFIGGL